MCVCVCVGLVPWAIKVIPLLYSHQQVCVCVSSGMAVGCSSSMDSRGTLGNGLCWAKWLQETQILLLSDKKQHIFPFHICSHLLMTEKGGKCHLWWFLQGIGFHGALRMWGLSTPSHLSHTGHMTLPVTWLENLPAGRNKITVFIYCSHLDPLFP